jgi:hypothetical protein
MTRTTMDSDQRTSTPGGANAQLSALDEERQASMADEGGVSGALMEVDGEDRVPPRARRRFAVSWKWALGLVLVGFAGAFVHRASR